MSDADHPMDEVRGFVRRIRRLVRLAFAANFVLAALLGLSLAGTVRGVVEAESQRSSSLILAAEIRLLDEVLTMSARMAAATGDPRWEERYLSSEPELDRAIQAASAASPERVAALDASNHALVTLELAALEQARSGHTDVATGILDSPAYAQEKVRYASGLEDLVSAVERTGLRHAQVAEQTPFFTLFALAVLLTTGVLAWVLFSRELHRVSTGFEAADSRTIRLDRLAHDLRELAEELANAEHRERQRLAEALHEGLQQTLYAVRLHLSIGETAVATNLVEESIRATRALAHEMEVPPTNAGLEDLLARLTRSFDERHHIAIAVTCVDPEHVHALSPFARDLLVAVSRELLFNVVKHAAVDTARITVTGAPTFVRLEVADDGVGADPPAGGTLGMGLTSVRRRILAAGGHFQFETSPGRGTKAVVELPLGGGIGNMNRPSPKATTPAVPASTPASAP